MNWLGYLFGGLAFITIVCLMLAAMDFDQQRPH